MSPAERAALHEEIFAALTAHSQDVYAAVDDVVALVEQKLHVATEHRRTVLAIHRTNGFPVQACMHDGCPWPCPTAVAVDYQEPA